jgi:hypothetical protein
VTRYRLPDALGGGEWEGDPKASSDTVKFDLPGGGHFWVTVQDVDEVKPPLPPEPPYQSIVTEAPELGLALLRAAAGQQEDRAQQEE